MKIAIPTVGSILDEYMSSCEVFTIYTIDESFAITDTELLYTPEGCDCKNNIPLTFQQKGVVAVVGYKMPESAKGVCEQHKIKFYEGYSGNIDDVISLFITNYKCELLK
jgi:predicted Fe-Mo cluster-binding NifX family protein